MATPDVPVWSRDYYYGRDPETNPGTPLPPPNTTPWLKPSVVNQNDRTGRNDYIDAVSAQYRPGWIGDRMLLANLAGTPEMGNIAIRSGADWSGQRTSGTRWDEANNYGKTPPDPNLIGNTGSVMAPIAADKQIPAGMMVNPFWDLPGQEPYITKEAYDALYAPGGVMNMQPVGPAGDAYDAVLQTRGNPADLGYDPGAPWQRENDYYAALKMRNDLGNATSAGYVTRQNPDGTFNVSGLTTPNAQGQWMPDARANVNDVNIRSTYTIGSPPYGDNKGTGPGQNVQNAPVTQDPLQYLMSQEINPSQARIMPGYDGKGAQPVYAPYGATAMQWPGVDVPLGGQTYEEAIAKGSTDPTLAGLYANNAPPSVVPGGTGAAGLAAPNPNAPPPPPPAPSTNTSYTPQSAPDAAPAPRPAPDVQSAADKANADGYYMGISIADWAATLDTMHPEEKAKFLADNPLLSEKLVRGYRTGGWTMPGAPFMVGESGPEIVQPGTNGRNFVMPMLNRTSGGGRTSSNTGNPGGSGPITTQPINPTPLQDTRPWWERDVPNPRGIPAPETPAPGSAGDMSNPWDGGKNVMLPQNFWALSPLEQQAILNGMAGDKYNPDYIRGQAAKYRLGGVGGWNNTQGY